MRIKKERGQATIELMIILTILLVILGVAVNVFATQRNSVIQQTSVQLAQRQAENIAMLVTRLSGSPIGSTVSIFLPPTPSAQTIYIRSGFVEVRSGEALAFAAIPMQNVSLGPFSDGNTIVFSRGVNGVTGTA